MPLSESLNEFEVAYVLFRFPVLTETFVANEIWALQQQEGIKVRLLSLLKPKDEPIHPLSEQLATDVWYAPDIFSRRLWRAQLYFLTRSPRRYLRLLVQLLRQTYPTRFLDLFLKRATFFLKAIASAYQLKNTSVKVIHTHFAWLSGAAARIISELLDLPFTVTVHAYDIFSTENDLLCFATSAAERVIAISEFNKQTVLQTCPTVKERTLSVIHCGIDLDLFHPSIRTDNETLSILAVGSLTPKKGHRYLIQACRQLKADGVDFRCTIIGGGPQEPKLKQLIREYNLEGQIDLSGPRKQPEVIKACQQHDLFVLACAVLPSGARDGIPVVLMEALAMQMPVISTPVSGIPELVRHGETGWIVPERDAAAIAEAITHLAADKSLRERLGHNGRVLVEREFEIQGNAAQLAAVFRQI
jgi:glycosyltransferase involved in cell wall biosynthesis